MIASSVLLFACNGKNGNANTGNNTISKTAATSYGSSSGNASFTVNIDGAEISGNTIDGLQLTNTAFIYPGKDENSKSLLFFLNSNKQGEDFYSLRFSFPDKEGEYKFNHKSNETCNCHLMLDYYLKSKEYYPRYNEDSVTVSIDKISSTRISGTLSGILKLSSDTQSKPYPIQVVLTEGKFDIPFSTGNMKPE